MQAAKTTLRKREIEALEQEFSFLQRRCRELNIPVLIVFEGYRGSGRGAMINRVIQPLDPRGYTVSCITAPTLDEQMRPFLWRFWMRIPSEQCIAIFDRSWYWNVLDECILGKLDKAGLSRAYKEVITFEEQLNDSNVVIFKFFLEISEQDQEVRLEKLRNNPLTAWRTSDNTPFRHYDYNEYKEAAKAMITATDLPSSPWKVLNTDHVPSATAAILSYLVDVLRNNTEELVNSSPTTASLPERALPSFDRAPNLESVDLSKRLKKNTYRQLLAQHQKRVSELHHKIHKLRIPVVIVYEGWDASGKGGSIRRLTQEMDPRGYKVVPTSAPNETEKIHHYLWRFYKRFPRAGHVTIFDRSWYGRVLVERVEGFCEKTNWQRAYGEINTMEEIFSNFGTVVVKFWIHIDKQEQERRFKNREATPFKRWKMTDEDWRNREEWDSYEQAVNEMFLRTHPPHAPWIAVEGNCKRHARIKTLEVVIKAIETKIAEVANHNA